MAGGKGSLCVCVCFSIIVFLDGFAVVPRLWCRVLDSSTGQDVMGCSLGLGTPFLQN